MVDRTTHGMPRRALRFDAVVKAMLRLEIEISFAFSVLIPDGEEDQSKNHQKVVGWEVK